MTELNIKLVGSLQEINMDLFCKSPYIQGLKIIVGEARWFCKIKETMQEGVFLKVF